MSLNNKEYFLIFDTNILFQQYGQKADFTEFSFNATFNNTVDLINQLDIYEKVVLVIPQVVWNEMKRQIIEKHTEKILEFEKYTEKWRFPEYSTTRNDVKVYDDYINKRIENYKNKIASGLNKIFNLPLPNKDRFSGIINRAFQKRPPFGGKEKNSDKGFKDALLWESILEFTSSHQNASIIFYTKDNGFEDVLLDEFNSLYKKSSICICSSENEVKDILQNWAKEIDIYSFTPLDDNDEQTRIKEWFTSEDFSKQIRDLNCSFIEKGKFIEDTKFQLINYDDMEIISDDGFRKECDLNGTLLVSYFFQGGTSISEEINVVISLSIVDETGFFIEDVYKNEDEEI